MIFSVVWGGILHAEIFKNTPSLIVFTSLKHLTIFKFNGKQMYIVFFFSLSSLLLVIRHKRMLLDELWKISECSFIEWFSMKTRSNEVGNGHSILAICDICIFVYEAFKLIIYPWGSLNISRNLHLLFLPRDDRSQDRFKHLSKINPLWKEWKAISEMVLSCQF